MHSVEVRGNPTSAIIDIDGFLWSKDDGITKIDTYTGEVVGHCKEEGYGIAVDHMYNVWLGDSEDEGVRRLDAETGELLAHYHNPYAHISEGISVGSYGDIWLANSSSNNVTRFNPLTGEVRSTIPVGQKPVGLTIDVDKNVWVVNNRTSNVTKINTNPAQGEFPGFPFATSTTAKTDNTFVLLANNTAVSKFTDASATQTIPQGFIDGVEWFGVLGSKIVLDQGLDTNQIPFNIAINDGDLIEESWIFEAYERILVPLTPDATQVKPPSFVDNDSIATYLLDDNEYYEAGAGAGNANANFKSSVIQGPRGPRTLIPIAAGDLVKYSDYLHNQIGVTVSGFFDDGTNAIVIDTKFRLKGNNTGMTIDVPVRVVRSV